MAEHIDREAFKKSVEERYCKPCKAEKKDHNGCWCRACWVDDMLDEVECSQPADVAPVVRCKDCKWDRPDTLLDKHWCSRLLGSMEVRADDFCSYGKRKDGEEHVE